MSYYREWHTSGNMLLGSTKYYGNTCAGYKMIFVTLKRLLKTQIFEKKTVFPPKKLFRPIFSRIIQYEKPQGTKYRGLQAIVTVVLQDTRSFLYHLRGGW